MLQPRLVAYYGDDAYRYSGQTMSALQWTSDLLELKNSVEEKLQLPSGHFNGVLCNLYRDGKDSMGFHSDDEKSLGDNPAIASLSFGATRKFLLRHKTQRGLKAEFMLSNGSLLFMGGRTQAMWKHAVPKTSQQVGERINLTFRRVVAPPAPAPTRAPTSRAGKRKAASPTESP